MESRYPGFQQISSTNCQNQLFNHFQARLQTCIVLHYLNHFQNSLVTQIFPANNKSELYMPTFNMMVLNKKDPNNRTSFPIESDKQYNNSIKINRNKQISQVSLKLFKKFSFSKIKKSLRKGRQDEEYIPQEPEEKQKQIYLSTTKNAIRNCSRWVLSYILENKSQIDKVLQHCKTDKQSFYQFVKKQRNNITNTIKLKSLWVQQKENQSFTKAMRIIFFNYMRKHYLYKTFNSKTRYLSRSLRYKSKLEKGLKNPNEFSLFQLKQV